MSKKTTPAQRERKPKAMPPVKPLSIEEQGEAMRLIDEAHTCNLGLIEAGSELVTARERLSNAELRYAELREENTSILARLAPLLHRLPV